ncbi:polyprenyl synthetase family protein [Aceticella autotrophica]|uniref:Farnesyl diphosphate synthase n=1 Tax=Aceticella autotrophica TaxID=2755338 RepID=A0A975AU80_9THEO|nr:farnesyl diphosphate synthase [Aceticella autotrophica]QSZ26505.1 polyprenyl synthetase family protein [Aceticella autotrophica]
MFKEELNRIVNIVDEELKKLLDISDKPSILFDAMRYSTFAGGKRLRPVLCVSTCELVGGSIKDVLPVACAIEFIHTYSLIHDDLPAMDNDDLRRGKPTNHKVFGEAIAILAGDALLNYGFEILIQYALDNPKLCNNILKSTKEIANASGARGMVAGQVIDILSENKNISIEELEFMHKHKTGDLIKAAVSSGAYMGGADEDTVNKLKCFADYIGLVFQIKDDLLDVLGDEKKLGKKTGSDLNNGKSTFITAFGLKRSKEMVNELTLKANEILDFFGTKGNFLKNLANYMAERAN